MYKCKACGKQSSPGEGQSKRVTEVRRRSYENVITRGKKSFVIKSEGFEIVREVPVCSSCSKGGVDA